MLRWAPGDGAVGALRSDLRACEPAGQEAVVCFRGFAGLARAADGISSHQPVAGRHAVPGWGVLVHGWERPGRALMLVRDDVPPEPCAVRAMLGR